MSIDSENLLFHKLESDYKMDFPNLISRRQFNDRHKMCLKAHNHQLYHLGIKKYFEALFRIHNAGAFFVTGAKNTMCYDAVEQNFNVDETTGLRADKTVLLTVAKLKKLYPEPLRLVEFYDCGNDEWLVFLTNNFEVSVLEVANLYKNRWQIVFCFKFVFFKVLL